MAVKRKKIGAAGRFGAGYGKVKERFSAVEDRRKKRQECPFCGGRATRKAKAIWECSKCSKVFANGVFELNKKI